MTTRLLLLSTVLVVLLSFPAISSDAESERSDLRLEPLHKRALSAEMNRIQNSMGNLLIAISAGRWEEIIESCRQMKDGFIMKRKLSKEEMTKFYNMQSSGYREIDNEYQTALGKLITAAQVKDIDSVNKLYCELNSTCSGCHAAYAVKRFPGFKN